MCKTDASMEQHAGALKRDASALHVTKRDGRRERFDARKIGARIEKLSFGLHRAFVDPSFIASEVAKGIYDGITSRELDDFLANFISTLTFEHPDFALLAGRVAVSALHKRTKSTFSEVVEELYRNGDPLTGKPKPLLACDFYDVVMANKERLNAAVVHKRDFDFSYFAFRTLERAYLMHVNGRIVERPQFMFMRVAVAIHGSDIDAAIETYELMSRGRFIHATATLVNAGRSRAQLASCNLLPIVEDSVAGIYETLKRCALISKHGSSVGLAVHGVRANGSEIDGTPKLSHGIVPILRVFNATAASVMQGVKRPGAFAVYLEPWHSDIFEFLQLRLNVGAEEQRCRDLFLGLWIPDLFMKRVEADVEWSLMSPNECPGLDDVFGEEFERLYERYECEGRLRKTVKARDLWRTIIASQCETGLPYMLYKDACNRKSNQQNLGTIKCSNLCTEIVEYSSASEVATCVVASIAVNRFVDATSCRFDFDALRRVAATLTRNLNRLVDSNAYSMPEARLSNQKHRPIGICVQGLADAFILMRFAFTSPKARLLNKQIFETIYYGALEASCELAERYGAYETYEGSPVSKGLLQYDMWGVEPTDLWDWAALKERIKKHGVKNSLLTAPMPTATVAQILGNNEAFEPYTSNMYTRRVMKGDFQVVNQHLVRDLVRLGLWTAETRDHLIRSNGSVQHLPNLPAELKELYRTVWEIRQLDLIEMAADRGAFIDQSQSLNLFVESPNYTKCTTMHFRAWQLGLKTGMYYLRSKPSVNPVKFTIKKQQRAASDGEAKEPNCNCC